MSELRQLLSGWGFGGTLVALAFACIAIALGIRLSLGWRPSRRLVTWTVAVVAIALTPVVVQVAASYLMA